MFDIIHSFVHIHTCTHAHTHTRTHADTHTRTHAYTHTHAHKHARAQTHISPRTHAHVRARAHAHTHSGAQTTQEECDEIKRHTRKHAQRFPSHVIWAFPSVFFLKFCIKEPTCLRMIFYSHNHATSNCMSLLEKSPIWVKIICKVPR